MGICECGMRQDLQIFIPTCPRAYRASTLHYLKANGLKLCLALSTGNWGDVISVHLTHSACECRYLIYLNKGSAARYMKIQLRGHFDVLFQPAHLIFELKMVTKSYL